MVSQPIINSIQKAATQNIGIGLKGLHRNHYSAPSGGGYHQHHHIYHTSDGGGYGHGHSEHGGGGGKKRSIALSALTLLAFLFFLNILQNCIEEQMDDNNQQFIVMTSRLQQLKEGQAAIANAKSDVEDSNSNAGGTNIKRNFQKIPSQRKADHFPNSNSYPNTTVKIITKNKSKISRP